MWREEWTTVCGAIQGSCGIRPPLAWKVVTPRATEFPELTATRLFDEVGVADNLPWKRQAPGVAAAYDQMNETLHLPATPI
jgi:hypothetical protein